VAALALADLELPRCFLHRTLDDTPIICPKNQQWGDSFANNYRRVCQEVGLTLAADDPNSVKAFSRQTRGIVLGFTFDTVSSTWLLPEGKFDDVARLAEVALLPGREGLPLEDIQKLLGKLESVAQLFPFMKGFRWQLLQWLRAAIAEPDRPAASQRQHPRT